MRSRRSKRGHGALAEIKSLQEKLRDTQVDLALTQNDLEDKRAIIDLFNDGGQVPDEGLWAQMKKDRDKAVKEAADLQDKVGKEARWASFCRCCALSGETPSTREEFEAAETAREKP